MIDKFIIKDNLEEVWEAVPFSYFKYANWYQNANKIAQNLSIKYNYPISTVSGVIAGLSPQKSWHQNLIITSLFLEQRISKHTKIQTKKVQHILKTKNPYKIEQILGGKKTQNFFWNIYDPSLDYYVCFDSHMSQLISGNSSKKVLTDKEYSISKEIFIDFAFDKGFKPNALQSILWEYYRNQKWNRNFVK